MLLRVFVILGIVLALFGVMVAPGFATIGSRRRKPAIRRTHPDGGEVSWNLEEWIPVGFLLRYERSVKREWKWMPKFRRVV